ncbi:hypothetical protein [Streptomyces xanthophaeus]|uniref:hypothetical protein n=1 Tax=Streptomyces xanthophaeus TaxID=67385 RepID=UPI002647D72C|nr:hypothetical protein [Streptomyces xanthophaeus]WKD36597.1 hypothetical protein KO717_34805 [Streptomyces xanthophaeus]
MAADFDQERDRGREVAESVVEVHRHEIGSAGAPAPTRFQDFVRAVRADTGAGV